MSKVRIEFEVVIPDTDNEPTQEQIEDWLKYSFGIIGRLSGDNPFINHEPTPNYGSFFIGNAI